MLTMQTFSGWARTWAMLLWLGIPIATQAQYGYLINGNGTVSITSYSGSGGAVNIPSTINGRAVTHIWDEAFKYSGLTSVTIPGSVVYVGNRAFAYCPNLVSVTIPGSVTSAGEYVFSGCRKLSNVTIGYGVNEIWYGMFSSCSSLTSLTIPNSVTNISIFAFSYCYNLMDVAIPNSVTSISPEAFYRCTSLATITIPGSVTHLDYGVFSECSALWGVYFCGNAPTSVGENLFLEAYNVTVYYLAGTLGWKATFAGRPTCPYVIEGVSSFSLDQTIRCVGAGWSRTMVMDLTYFYVSKTQDGYGSYSVEYSLFYDDWMGIYIYDYDTGAFSAVTWQIKLDL